MEPSSDPTNRRDEKLPLQKNSVKGEPQESCGCPCSLADKLTGVVDQGRHVVTALEDAVTLLSRIFSLVRRVIFILAETFSIGWLTYLIVVEHLHPHGFWHYSLTASSAFIFVRHLVHIVRGLGNSRETEQTTQLAATETGASLMIEMSATIFGRHFTLRATSSRDSPVRLPSGS